MKMDTHLAWRENVLADTLESIELLEAKLRCERVGSIAVYWFGITEREKGLLFRGCKLVVAAISELYGCLSWY
jgi:type II secretory pathway component PulM